MKKLSGAIHSQDALANKKQRHIQRACTWGKKLRELETRCYREGLIGQDIAAEANKAFRYFYKQLEDDLFSADIPGYDRMSLNRYRRIYKEELIKSGDKKAIKIRDNEKQILKLSREIIELKYK